MQMRNNHESVCPPYAVDLPATVLKKIFLALHDSEKCTERCGQGFQASWVPITTWVCQRWRKVALATPQLWSHFDITMLHCDPDAIEILVERAGDEELDISVNGTALDMSFACALVQPVAHRIKHLSVFFEESQALAVELLLLHLGPTLKVLQMTCTSPSAREITLNTQLVPGLRQLRVCSVFVRLTGPLYDLETLQIESLWEVRGPGKRSPSHYLYEMLALCPDVIKLELLDAMAGAHRLDSSTLPFVTLSILQEVHVNEQAIDLPGILANIAIPPSAEVHIIAQYDGFPPEPDDEDAVRPMDVLPENRFDNFPQLAETELLSLQIGSRTGTLPDILIEGQDFSVEIPTLEDVSGGGGNRLPEFATHVLDGLPAIVEPTRIRYLDLHIAQNMPEYPHWAALLTMFPNVAGFTIGGRRAFFGAMRALRDGGPELLLPNLKQLTVCFAAPEDANTVVDARAFAAWLAKRAAAGKMLETLVLSVPHLKLNEETLHLAYSLVAYMSVRKGRVRVTREWCGVCHRTRRRTVKQQVQVDLPKSDPEDEEEEEEEEVESDTETVTNVVL